MTRTVLRGGRALVTGAARRVGRSIALALGREGMHVAVHYNQSAVDAEETCREIETAGGRAFALKADLGIRANSRNLVPEAIRTLGGLDLLVASAAAYERVAWDAVDDAAWDAMLEVNLHAPFLMAQTAAPHLAKSRGSIVFITCASTRVPYRQHLPYVVSKGGLSHLMRTLAVELAPEVRVNAVAPGTVSAPEDLTETEQERIRSRIPLRRFGAAEDIAEAVLYLASAPFVTGQEIHVDGGRGVAGL